MFMIAFVKVSLRDGISKKIMSQASAISKKKNNCTLLCLNEESRFQKIIYENGLMKTYSIGNQIKTNITSLGRVDPFIKAVEAEVGNSRDGLYIRHMIPSLYYLKFLKKYSLYGIFYEIPTYPYYYEQIKASNNKALTLLRLSQETLFWPLIYKTVTKIVAIPCNSTAIKFKKMQYITNCYSSFGKYIPSVSNNTDKSELNLLGVGTIQRYHGYEKIIELMHKSPNVRAKFIIVGGGEVSYLKTLVKDYQMTERVVFTGPKGGEELERLYAEADVGVGTMALELRKADIDTGIKILDYYIHGLPVVSSGVCPWNESIGERPFIVLDKMSKMEDIIELNNRFDIEARRKLANSTAEQYSWETVMGRVLND